LEADLRDKEGQVKELLLKLVEKDKTERKYEFTLRELEK
jgi:hypothetical protein